MYSIFRDQVITLITFSEQHLQKTFEWIGEPEFQHQFMMRSIPTWEEHNAHFKRILTDSKQVVYAINMAGEHVGNCGFKNIIEKIEAELWIYIGSPLVRNKGVGRFATELLLEKGFNHFHMSSIYLHVADFNTSARALYQKLGFHEVPLRGDASDWSDRGCKIIRMELEDK